MKNSAARPGRLALLIISALLLAGVPYGWSVWTKSKRYQAYLDQTLNASTPPRWVTQTMSPEACLNYGFEWLHACPGVREFCRRGFRQLLRTCMASRDRTDWCAQDKRWASTTFGYTACEHLETQTTTSALAEVIADHCTHGFLVLADHCQRLATTSPESSP